MLAIVLLYQLEELQHDLVLAELGVVAGGRSVGHPAHHQEKQPVQQLEGFLHVGLCGPNLQELVQKVDIGAKSRCRSLVQLVEGRLFCVLVKQVGVSLAQPGKIALRKEDKGSFEVLAYLIGLDNLGGKHNEEAVFMKTERA